MDEPRSEPPPDEFDPDLSHEVEQRTLVGQAAAFLLERYELTPEQAATFLEEKAAEDKRDVADVALEILREQSTPPES